MKSEHKLQIAVGIMTGIAIFGAYLIVQSAFDRQKTIIPTDLEKVVSATQTYSNEDRRAKSAYGR